MRNTVIGIVAGMLIATGLSFMSLTTSAAGDYIEFIDRDHARINAYWQTVFGSAGESVPVRVAAAGRSVDDLVRLNGKWLIKTRNVTPQD